MTIQLLALDVDGTLENSQHRISERTEAAVKAALAKGVHVVVATGKTPAAIAGIVQRFSLATPAICIQGTYIINADRSVRQQSALTPDAVRQVVTFAEDRGFMVAAYSGTRIMMRSVTSAAAKQYIESQAVYRDVTPEPVGAIQNVLDEFPIHKICLIKISDGQTVQSLRFQLNAQIGKSIHTVLMRTSLEVLPPGVNKGTALRLLLKDLKVPAEQVMAIGDADNDVEMLQVAGLGVAVGNATEKLKAAAKHVVASTDDEGVAEAIEKFVLDAPAQQPLPTAPEPAAAAPQPVSPATRTDS